MSSPHAFHNIGYILIDVNPGNVLISLNTTLPYSSKGVSKAENREELEAALYEAVKHDRNILCKETIVGREVECAVLGDRTQVKSTCVGEILAAEEAAFYDFDAKYNNAESKTVVDPEMPEESKRKIKEDAEAIFRAVTDLDYQELTSS